ncbi:putative cytochrome P450 [Hypoxylon trugodes]|uniref:putative cytochrome P450 n=1 Tax=Hypoxylon trugodes TaxID=326681 RepID=UPI002199C496|nr:putative cytochrome P450 [Hypoxylon trugodes]KAI1394186.1 putative cytochrome P450 [Hypoxylon trugodes]
MAVELETSLTMSQPDIDLRRLVGGLMTLSILYWSCVVFYRLFLSNLAKFPGPKLAAATGWYEAFIDLYSSNFPDVLEGLHEKYGPIVRINPWELSYVTPIPFPNIASCDPMNAREVNIPNVRIRDADFYNELYVSGGKRRTNLIYKSRAGLGMSDAISTTHSHELHQLRRKAVESFFSRQSVSRMESRILDEATKLDDKLRLLAGTNTIVQLDHAYACVTGDLAALFACGENPRLIESPDFNPGCILEVVPVSLLQKLSPNVAGFRMFHQLSQRRVEAVKSHIASKPELEESDKTSIFHYILQSDLPGPEKESGRLQREAFALLAAGTITTASTLCTITYYVLADPAIEKRLRDELKGVMSDFPKQMPRWADLEKVPYLMGCIKEGLRIARFFRRSPRISPDYDLQYKQWTIPKNTPVGMSVCHMHMDPEVYPEPYKFIPERWIGDVDPRVNRNFVPFVKGSRNCLGMNLAWAEMFIVLGILFRPGGHRMSLNSDECDESDIALIHDSDVGIPKSDSRGLRVRFQ